MIKTVIWSDCNKVIVDEATRKLCNPWYEKIENFIDLVNAYPFVSKERLGAFFDDEVPDVVFNDVTNEVIALEDGCLFDSGIDSSIDIILRHLRVLNTGEKLKSLWYYLDCEKKAVVHFVDKCGWYAEVYFSCNKDFSALHVIKEGGSIEFIPIVFSTDMSDILHYVDKNGRHILHDYFPRDIANFIPKKSFKKKSSDNVDISKSTFYYDKGDML